MLPKRGLVAAGHAATAEAGAMILRDGGNAVDAAIAAACTAFVAEPVLTGAGGGGFMLVRETNGRSILLDGFARMPSGTPETSELCGIPIDFGDTVQTFHIGQGSVGTPSLLAMLFTAHRNYGRLPLIETLAPALAAMRNGVRLNRLQASFIHLLEPILMRDPECSKLHAPNGALLGEGDLFRNPDLANILEMLAIDGINEMYRGDLARAMVSACEPCGLLTMEDLASPQVYRRKPLQAPCFGGCLLTNPPPSSGGLLIAFAGETLHRLKNIDTPWLIGLIECMREASLLRSSGFDARIHEAGIAEETLAGTNLSRAAHHIRQRLSGIHTAIPAEPANRHGSTTHVSIVDADGMAVSMTSSNGEGSGIVVPGTGIHLNNMLGEEDINPLGFHRLPPGQTLSSMMAPSMFVEQRRLRLVLGSGGSNRLRGAILQVLARVCLQGEDIETAVHAPRAHNEASELDVEPGLLNDSLRMSLSTLGWKLREWRDFSVYFGGVHAIALDPHGNLQAAGDPRRGGSIAWG